MKTYLLNPKIMRNFYARTMLYACLFTTIPSFVDLASANDVVQENFQQRMIKGVVLDEAGIPIIGANIVQRGTSNGTITDFEGNFELNIQGVEELQISYIGYLSQTVKVKGKDNVRIILKEDSKTLEEVVVVGFGTAKKQDLTSAITSVKGESLNKYKAGNVTNALQGQVAGVSVTTSSGVPGSEPKVVIRGISTFSDNSPLYVVNGVPMGTSINYLNPSDIESMEVLKDASASAIYGTRASNGVILVTTKKGKEGKVRFNLDSSFGLQTIQNPGMADAYEYAKVMNQIAINDGKEDLPFADMSGIAANTNWWNEVMNTVAPMQKYDLSFSGGNDKIVYASSIGYFNQKSQLDKGYWEKLSARFDMDYKFNKYISFGQEINLNYINKEATPDVISNMLKMDPTTPVMIPEEDRINDGVTDRTDPLSWYHRSIHNQAWNPVGAVARANSKEHKYKFISNSNLIVKPIKGLELRSQLGFNFEFQEKDSFSPIYFIDNLERNQKSSISRDHNNTLNWAWNNTITYNTSINKNNITLMAGSTMEEYNYRSLYAKREDVPGSAESLQQIDAATGNMDMNGNLVSSSLMSYFARINYNFANKYYLTATGRYDGSSKFTKNNRWAFFPSVSAAWRVSEEAFMKSQNVISNLKLRIGWGQIGNQNIDNGAYLNLLTPTYYPIGADQTLNLAYLPSSVSNPDVKWETVEDLNFGLDFGFFDNKLSVTAEYYVRTTHDMLMQAKNPIYAGYPTTDGKIWSNVGSIRVNGWEVSADYRDNINDIQYNIGFTASGAKNKALVLANGEALYDGKKDGVNFITKTVEGGAISEYYGYICEGIFQSQSEIDNYTFEGKLIQDKAVPGDFKFKDLNNDGVINDDDKTNIGNPYPKVNLGLNGGFNYRNFDVSVSFYSSLGGKNFNYSKYITDTGFNSFNVASGTFDNSWREDNTNATQPRLSSVDMNGNYSKASTYYVENSSFLRCKDLQIGYTFSNLHRVGINQLRIYASVQNLFVITGYSGQDPEVGGGTLSYGIDTGLYPIPRTYLLGLNVSF